MARWGTSSDLRRTRVAEEVAVPDRDGVPVEVAPITRGGSLAGFLISNRWPDDTLEWATFLLLAVQTAAVPGLLGRSTVFRVIEAPPEGAERAVGLVLAEVMIGDEEQMTPGRYAEHPPPGLAVLHPPGSTLASVPEYRTASGCILLPGLPDLGLDHRAAWVEADAEGHVTRMASRGNVDPGCDADTAALALLLAG
ncbi:peptidase [Ornithinimicrobium sp. LYQ103]